VARVLGMPSEKPLDEMNMMSDFFDDDREEAHKAFQLWWQDNPAGFFINCKAARDWMLHRVNCLHPGSTDWQAGEWGSLTKRRKVCSTNRQELVKWARQHGTSSLKTCSDCKP
jgi:hypothetical protein